MTKEERKIRAKHCKVNVQIIMTEVAKQFAGALDQSTMMQLIYIREKSASSCFLPRIKPKRKAQSSEGFIPIDSLDPGNILFIHINYLIQTWNSVT